MKIEEKEAGNDPFLTLNIIDIIQFGSVVTSNRSKENATAVQCYTYPNGDCYLDNTLTTTTAI